MDESTTLSFLLLKAEMIISLILNERDHGPVGWGIGVQSPSFTPVY